MASIDEWFAGKSAEALELVEFKGRFLYADTIKRKNPKTAVIDEKPVLLRVPTATEQTRATMEACDLVASLRKSKGQLDVAQAKAVVGDARFEELDTVCLMARCILRTEEPHAPLMVAELLDTSYPKASLYELFDRLDYYARLEDPRVGDITDERFWAVVDAIGRVRHTGPLVAIAGSERESFIVSMAAQLRSSRTPKSFLPSLETSTLED